MELNQAYVALASQLQKVMKGLTAEEALSVALGETRLMLVRSGEQVLPKSRAVDNAVKALSSLAPDDVSQVEQGGAALRLVRAGERVLPKSRTFDTAVKAVNSLSPDDIGLIEQRGAALKLVRTTERVLPKSKALDAALRVLNGLTPDEVEMVERKAASLKLVRPHGKVVYPINHVEIAEEVSRLEPESAIIKYLDSDDRLKPADLRKIASELGIVVPASMKATGDMETYIARNLMAYGMSSE